MEAKNTIIDVTFKDLVAEAGAGDPEFAISHLTNRFLTKGTEKWAQEHMESDNKNLRLLAAKIISLKESQRRQTDADSKML